jgi:hypothetical protein
MFRAEHRWLRFSGSPARTCCGAVAEEAWERRVCQAGGGWQSRFEEQVVGLSAVTTPPGARLPDCHCIRGWRTRCPDPPPTKSLVSHLRGSAGIAEGSARNIAGAVYRALLGPQLHLDCIARTHTDAPPHATPRPGIDCHRRRSPRRELAAGTGGPAEPAHAISTAATAYHATTRSTTSPSQASVNST